MEGRAAARLALDPGSAFVGLGDLADDGQAHAGAVAPLTEGLEHLEDPLVVLGIDPAAEVLHALFERLPLARGLGAVGVAESDIAGLAAGTMDDYMMANLPRPVSEGEVAALLEAAL